jgi:phosphoribosylformylglycinamidine synthase
MAKKSKAVCNIRLKDGVLDPQGQTIKQALQSLGYDDIVDVRTSKTFTLTFASGVGTEVEAKALEICRKLLANPVIEEYTVEEG